MGMTFNGKPLKGLANKLVHTKFQMGWQWVLEFSGKGINPPSDFEIYAKSVEHGGATLEYEEKQIGANTINSPTHKTAGTITLIIRDNEDGRCEKFFAELIKRVVNDDGTVNLPAEYLFSLRMYRLMDDDRKELYRDWMVSIAEYGSFTRSNEEVGQFVTYPAIFKKYQALGKE
jgi:hypothetical protein